MNIFVVIRLLLGVLFLISGGEKLLSPVENFTYVIEGYKVLSLPLARAAAQVFPWVEIMAGVFVLTGLWLRQGLVALMLVSVGLMAIVGQAIVRRLPLGSCGCFGELVHLPLKGVILLDAAVFMLSFLCLRNMTRTMFFSLDGLYAQGK